MRIFRFILSYFALFFSAALFGAGAPLSFNELNKKPPSRVKDFASLLFLRSTSDDTQQKRVIFYSLKAPKPLHFAAFANGRKDASKLLACRKTETSKLAAADPACIAIMINTAKAESISNADLIKIAAKIKNIDPFNAAILNAMATKNSLETAAKDLDVFYRVALEISNPFFKKHSDSSFSRETIADIQKDSRFSLFLERSAQLSFGAKLLKSLAAYSDETKLDFKGAFYLGVIRVMQNDLKSAIAAFKSAETKALTRYEKDRALFWLYLIGKNESDLFKLFSSREINFYSLYFRLERDRPLPAILTQAPALKDAKDIYGDDRLFDPFFAGEFARKIADRDTKWLQNEIKKLGGKNAEAYRAAIYYALAGANSLPNYYLNPYPEAYDSLSIDELAMTLAIMRQESRYIPAALSTSYAMGSMQMMPFVLEAMMKENKDKGDLWSFFDPYRQAPYAIKHIKWLRRKLTNPLFIAYAYNGGLGFATRTIEGNKLFKQGEFEPFLSLERMPLEEPREYGKAVLANYLVYRRLLGAPITPRAVFQTK
ncbi:MAG: transglycosylase SLT domain-containing protein [Helicobacteraceae bacterium]|jgi:soluble lytic murein transglycosylase|nr:transglycosylase SLT domain-containing protein [Helicobacteraceae bacterium]